MQRLTTMRLLRFPCLHQGRSSDGSVSQPTITDSLLSKFKSQSQSRSHIVKLCYDRRSSTPLGTVTTFLLLLDRCGYVDMGHPLSEEDCVVYNCLWSSPTQSFFRPSPAGNDHILLSQIQDSPILEGQVPVFMPQEQVALGFPFIASYDSQGYCGGIRTVSTGSQSLSQSHITTDGRSLSQSVCLGIKSTLELVIRYYFRSESCCVVSVGFPLWREVGPASCQ
jgi:hypothetical protein